jgi:hypothetical protein
MFKSNLVELAKEKDISYTETKEMLVQRLRKLEQDGVPPAEERVVMEPNAVQHKQSSKKFENTVKVLNSIDEHINYHSKDHEKLQIILRDR